MKNFVKISITVKLFQAGRIIEPHYGNVKLILSVLMNLVRLEESCTETVILMCSILLSESAIALRDYLLTFTSGL
jgi:hypothetical protein